MGAVHRCHDSIRSRRQPAMEIAYEQSTGSHDTLDRLAGIELTDRQTDRQRSEDQKWEIFSTVVRPHVVLCYVMWRCHIVLL